MPAPFVTGQRPSIPRDGGRLCRSRRRRALRGVGGGSPQAAIDHAPALHGGALAISAVTRVDDGLYCAPRGIRRA